MEFASVAARLAVGVDRDRCCARSSKPLWGYVVVLGGFDSHALPPPDTLFPGVGTLMTAVKLRLGTLMLDSPAVCSQSAGRDRAIGRGHRRLAIDLATITVTWCARGGHGLLAP